MKPDADMTFANALLRIRVSLGITQTELAARCGLNPSAINHFERGRRSPHIRNLGKIATALGVSSDTLIGRGK